jgi:hypothetical protein
VKIMQTLKNERTSFPEAMKNILDTLEKKGDGISITSLANRPQQKDRREGA